jgi:lipoate-protein ligase A
MIIHPDNLIDANFYGHFATDPFFNMAFDEWMMHEVLTRPEAVILRLYTWSPGGITIGLNQSSTKAVSWDMVWDTPVIRRITGGRALYHDPSEYTYSVAFGSNAAARTNLERSVSNVSRQIAIALTEFVRGLGVGAEYARQSAPIDSRPVVGQKAPCFASTARYEVESDGRKIIASAQRRIGAAFLQHGSIKLAGIADHPALFGVGNATGKSLQPIECEHFESFGLSFVTSLSETLGLRCRPSAVTPAVQKQVALTAAELKADPLAYREFRCTDAVSQ